MLIQAVRAHKAVGSRQSLAFVVSFALLIVGLFFRMITDVLFEVGFSVRWLVQLYATHVSTNLFLLLSALGILASYTLLLLVVERITNPKMWILVTVLVLFTTILARNIYLVYHVLAIIVLALLAHAFWMNFLQKNSSNALIVYLAFFALLAAHVAALFAPLDTWPHVIFLVLRLVGYFLLFTVSWRATHR